MNSYSGYEGQQDLISSDVLLNPVVYAGFWLRVAAYFIDIISLYLFAIIIMMGLQLSITNDKNDITSVYGLVIITIFLSYFPLMESSKWQATLGKRAVGIIVTDTNGERISFGKALARLFSKIISGIILYIGFMMAGFTEKKQGLHDMIANTLVIKK